MGLNRTPSHLELLGNFRIVTPLQQQIGDLLFPWTQANWLVFHPESPQECARHKLNPELIAGLFTRLAFTVKPIETNNVLPGARVDRTQAANRGSN
jgi:hypothetical protein